VSKQGKGNKKLVKSQKVLLEPLKKVSKQGKGNKGFLYYA